MSPTLRVQVMEGPAWLPTPTWKAPTANSTPTFHNPDLLVCCVVGDGEAETGPLAASWHSTKFLNPVRDGAVLPILHLNGYKIANPTLLGRMTDGELTNLFTG